MMRASFPLGWSVFGVAGVVGWDHGSAAFAFDEVPAVVGLEVVVVVTDPVELVEAGVFRFRHSGPWSFSRRWVRVQPNLVHMCDCHHSATCCATVADRPRWVTLTTSTPLVMTSLRIASPSSARAIRTGIGPSPAISQVSSPSTAPRTSASWSTRISPRSLAGVRFGLRASSSVVGLLRVRRLRFVARTESFGELDEGVERVGVVRFVAVLGPGELELRIDQRLPLGPEPGTVGDSPAGVQVPRPFPVDVLPRDSGRGGSGRGPCRDPCPSRSDTPSAAHPTASLPHRPAVSLRHRGRRSRPTRSLRPSRATTFPCASRRPCSATSAPAWTSRADVWSH